MAALNASSKVRYYLDSNTIIAILERSIRFTPTQERFLKAIDAGRITAFSSEIALTECLVKPIRDGEQIRIQTVMRFFDDEQTLPLVPTDRGVFLKAAELRALDYLHLPDAIHVACAMRAQCEVFVSADRRVRVPKAMRRISFDDLDLDQVERL